MATTKIQNPKETQFGKMPTSGGWAGCGNECAHITGNDYVISRSRLKLRRSLIAYHSTLKKGNLILGGWGLDGKRVQNEASAEMSFGECPCHNFDFELASESQSRLFIGHFARSGKFRQPLPCMPNTPPLKEWTGRLVERGGSMPDTHRLEYFYRRLRCQLIVTLTP